MDPIAIAALCALGVFLLVVPLVAGELAAARERRVGAALLREADARAERAEGAALDAAHQRDALVAANRAYLAAVHAVGSSTVSRDLGLLLDATEHAAGAAGAPPPGAPGPDRGVA